MLRRTAGTLALLALVVLTLSCRRLEGQGRARESASPTAIQNGMVLPAEWGNLIVGHQLGQLTGAAAGGGPAKR